MKTERDELQIQANHLSRQRQTVTTTKDNVGANMMLAYDAMTAIVEAIQLFKYADNDDAKVADYKIENLTPKQSTLIDALAEFGAKSADKINAVKHADRMRKFANVSDEILAEMKILNPDLFPKEIQKTRSSYNRDGR